MTAVPVAFFGLTVEPEKKYSQHVQEDFCLTMATLGATLPEKAGRTSVVVKIGDREFTLCSLTPGMQENQPLNLTIVAGEEISFHSVGNCSVDLTGNHVAFPEEMDDEETDDEDEMEFGGLSEEDDLSEGDMVEGEFEEYDDEEDDEEDDDDDEMMAITPEQLKKMIMDNKRKAQAIPSDKSAKKSKIVEITESEEVQEKPADVKEVKPKKELQEKKENKKENKKEVPQKENKKEVPQKEIKKESAESPAEASVKKLPNGLVMEDTLVGKGAMSKQGRKVSVRYIGRLTNGKVFDSNTKGAPFTFRLGKKEVIKGWDLGVAGMRVGGTRKLTIPPALAYGPRGAPPEIPPNATLVFEIKLLEVK